ncbi:nitronate monooxygenase [Enterococcus devriesei]|uniref:nitronate monooxygenase n=1 Tax=Enterococcus devriesei TaxID=319970 RepID=UPI001C11569B|nr:nitronate monooxygenase [Enterococcus devriesei]MBU5363787.1 nitronate monooxygenase [Enterococcus devriesei]MDT2822039.1 nitronate monooxygenase [Enterococcus devriesei]
MKKTEKRDLMAPLTELLGIQYPILQGAMAHIARCPLVGAVSEAGGLGIIAAGGLSGTELREQIRKTQQQTKKPFAVNLMLQMPNIAEQVEILIEEDVKIVTTGAGTPKPYMEVLKQARVKVFPVVPSVKLAQKMEQLGADGVIAEGMEAGGHIGETTTMTLLPQVTQAVKIPVIAAGGIGDGRGLAAAFALGAQGIQLGTAFLTAMECPIHENYRQAIIQADDTATTVIRNQAGGALRGLKNALTEAYLEEPTKDVFSLAALKRAADDGEIQQGMVMAGQVAGLLTEVRSAQEIIETIYKEAAAISRNSGIK